MSEWQPIETVPEGLTHVEGSYDGVRLEALYTLCERGGVKGWYRYSYESEKPENIRFWRPVRSYREIAATTVTGERDA